MGVELMAIVRRRVVGSATKKAVLLHMADSASDDGSGIWTSKANIARDLELSKRAVQSAVQELIAAGLVREVGQRGCKNGFTIEYLIVISAVQKLPNTREPRSPVQQAHPSGTRATGSPVQQVHGEGCSTFTGRGERGSPKPPLEPPLEPPTTTEREDAPDGDHVVVDGKSKAGHHPQDLLDHWQAIQSMLGCSGAIKPDGKLMNATSDQAEIPKWDRMGISRAEQLAVIADMLAKTRQRRPGFVPNGYGWLTAGMGSYVERRDADPTAGHKQPEAPLPPELASEKTQIDAEWQRLADQHGPEADAARQALIERMRQIRARAAA